MATADEYAQWIVANADKKGTPEFNIVAAAYQSAKQQQQQAMPKPDTSNMGENLLAGGIKGAANIGATLLTPVDWALKKTGLEDESFDRRKEIEAAMGQGGVVQQEVGFNPNSIAFKTGEIGTEIAGTIGVGGAIAKPLMYGAKYLPALGKAGQAIASAGFDVGAPAATTMGKVGNAALRVGGGATTGAASAGLINPKDVKTGAVAGGVFGAASPLIGKAMEVAIRKFATPNPAQLGASVSAATDDALNNVARDLGIPVNEIPASTVEQIKRDIATAMSHGKKLDAAAALRKAEFEKLGMNPLRGQITRDPTQYAQELNLRGVGTPIQERLTEQNQQLQRIFGEPAQGAKEAYQASDDIARTLGEYQEAQKAAIGKLYDAARAEGGRYANVDVASFTNEVNAKINEQMLGRFVPENIKGLLVDIGEGKIPLNVNNLVQVDSVLSAAQRNADAAGQKAIGVIRDALNNAKIESSAGGAAKTAFDTARKAARTNFAEQEAIPALKAVAQGDEVTTDFVRKHIIQSNNPAQVQRLAKLLREQNPDAFAQAKAQMADEIKRAAFGESMTVDSAIRPEMLAKKLRELGTDKMSAFFSPDEIVRYQTASRVAAYIAKHPNAAPVNTSNTLVAQLMNSPIVGMIGKVGNLPVVSQAVGVAGAATKAAAGAVKNEMATSAAMKAKVPVANLDLSESQRKLLVKILGATGSGTSAILAQ